MTLKIDADPTDSAKIQQLSKCLETLDSDYNTRHFAVIDVLEEEDQLAEEQETLSHQTGHPPTQIFRVSHCHHESSTKVVEFQCSQSKFCLRSHD